LLSYKILFGGGAPKLGRCERGARFDGVRRGGMCSGYFPPYGGLSAEGVKG